jgi:hypothetical protein
MTTTTITTTVITRPTVPHISTPSSLFGPRVGG